ncbi:hypothetical protein MNBD_GAMMA01-446 [hydrothermal vent metagenome]|uniref:Tyrosine specific protein phosphatases domain-containing protein n=1 Tax=hydrothermal vent metagenome TaxID=652676 RepID=A0A3B0UTZ8_9ZZZZ
MINASYNSDMLFLHKQWDKSVFQYNLNVGSITMMPKPPAGKQLSNFIQYLVSRKIHTVVSLLQFDEVHSFSLTSEGSVCESAGVEFINFPIQDHGVPQFFLPFNQLISTLFNSINAGENIAIHCYAGIGRTGLIAASILIKQGMDVDTALVKLSKTRGLRVPETIGQIAWLHRHASELSK